LPARGVILGVAAAGAAFGTLLAKAVIDIDPAC